MLTDRQLSLPTTSAPYPGSCVDTYLGLLEMSVGARQFVIVGPQLVEHVKYSVSSNGRSESGSKAQYLYPVCAICARHRPKELISSTSRTRRTCPRHTPQTVLIGGSPCSDLCIAVRTECIPTESHTIVMFLCTTCATTTHGSTDETQLEA